MIGVLVVTHGSIGEALLTSASQILGASPQQVATLSVWRQESPFEPWFKVPSIVLPSRDVEAQIGGFTGYAIEY